mmetsp:Transcript_141561/g.394550  ORF Transcript_141561/g.394550 Transcript_141561/m.394550 type:complete len:235 (-) Transcript_141561:133-837(-)
MGQSESSSEPVPFVEHPRSGHTHLCTGQAHAVSHCLSEASPHAEGSWLCSDPAHEVLEAEEEFGLSDWQLQRFRGRRPEGYDFTPMPLVREDRKDASHGLSHLQLHRAAAAAAGRNRPQVHFLGTPEGPLKVPRQLSPHGGVMHQMLSMGDTSEPVRGMRSADSDFGVSSWQLFHVPSVPLRVSPRHMSRVDEHRSFEKDGDAGGEKPCRVCMAAGLSSLCTDPSEDASLERPG